MAEDESTQSGAERTGDIRRAAIRTAALEQFSQRGLAGTSMAHIAVAAGVSRPALYQYYKNKADIFAAAFIALFEDQVEHALGALAKPGSTAERLDGFLQRSEGDLWQRMAASPHIDEIVGAKNAELALAVGKVVALKWEGLAEYLEQAAPGQGQDSAAQRASWLEVLRLSPMGFRSDQPTVETYRRRLGALARSVAADIDAYSG